jgi:membrane peptidoglycan carboxypeptidase
MKIAALLGHKPLHPLPKPNPIDISNHRNPRFTRIVRAELSRSGRALTGVRRVGLTIDRNVQHALRKSLQEAAVAEDVTHAAGIAVSLKTGDVLGESAFEFGREAESSPSYFGTLQPGSTFKTFALLSALQQGISLDDKLVSAPLESLCFVRSGSTPWRVRNYADTYRGELSLLEAFRYSDNTAFARLVEMLDTDALYRTYQAFGLGEINMASASIVLGGHKYGVNLLNLVAAYRSIAVGGNYARPRFLQYAELADGSLAWFPRAAVQPLVSDFRALRDLQRALLDAGPVIGALRYAGKTGTTRTGSLFAGYSDEVAAAIWIGYGKPAKEGDPKATGALGVFQRLMHRLVGRSDLLSI